jgi:aminopeptidase
MNKDKLDEKYVKLLLERCLNFDKSSILFINYNQEIKPFVTKIVDYAKKIGIKEIYLDEDNPILIHETLKNQTLTELETNPLFNKSIWDDYAQRNATFLMLETEYPNLMDDIEPEKLAKTSFLKRASRPIFREKETTNEISWCIAAYPGEIWSKHLFPNDINAYDKLYNLICKMCMLDTENPIQSWNNYIKESKKTIDKLNSLNISKLHYTNSKGTNLTINLPNNHIWVGSGNETNSLCNMPSYEIFTSPDYRYTTGTVYSSKPLIYNGGLIDNFYLKFESGKVIDYDAKIGKDILKGIIESDANSCYLGEVSLINYNSPISNTKVVFGTTLFDENASCHLALGDSFPECIKDGLTTPRNILLENGLNNSQNHVDFMIGTKDLNIIADTPTGKVQIFKDGNFNI